MDGRGGQLDVPHAVAPHLGSGHLDAATLADDALEPDPLVLAAIALPVLRRTEDLLAEEPVLLRLEGAVVDGLRLLDFAVGPHADSVRSGQADSDLVEFVYVKHYVFLRLVAVSGWCLAGCRSLRGGSAGEKAGGAALILLVGPTLRAGQVDAEFLGGAVDVLVEVPHLDLAAVLGEDLHVEAQGLHLLDEHLEALRDARLGNVVSLDDGLVDLDPAQHVIGLDGQELLEAVGGAVRLECPHLHLAESLATELGLTA